MARPKKQKELKRNHHIMLCLNDMEYDIVTENAKTANLPVAEYARKQIMNQRITLKYEVVADVLELKNLFSHMLFLYDIDFHIPETIPYPIIDAE